MTKKAFVVVLILSVIAVYTTTFIDGLVNNTLLGGEAGFPLKFTRVTMFGEGTTNYPLMVFNIAFWFLLILGVWGIIKRPKKNKKR